MYEANYEMLLQLAVDAFFQCDFNGNLIMVNDKAVELSGYNKEELLGLNIRNLFSEVILQQKPLRFDFPEEGEILKIERDLLRKDEQLISVEINLKKMPDGTFQSFFRDITQRNIIEKALAESENRYRRLHETMMDGYVYTNMLGNIVDSNEVYRQMLGYTQAELEKLTYLDLTPEKWHLIEHEIVANQILPNGHSSVYEKEYIRKDGTIFPVELRTVLIYDDKGVREGMWAIVRNITARKSAEERILESEEKFRDTINSLPDWIYVVDSSFRLVMINASLTDAMTFSIRKKEIIGSKIEVDHIFFSPEDIASIHAVFNFGHSINRRQKIFLTNRELFTEITMVPIRKNDEVVKVIVVIHDRSKEEEIEELKQRSADQKEVLLREIHHRVKNNLAIVISLLSFQLNENANPELRRLLVDIQTRIRAMALIHEHLYRSENLDKITLTTYITSLIQMIVSTFSVRDIRIETNLEPIEATIETALPVGLIVNELLTNAFKYAFPGSPKGTITIGLKKAEEDYCIVTVGDNGIGFPPAYLPESSSSLGLYIVRLLTEQLDGSIHIDQDHGATFTIKFRNLFRKSG